MPTSGRDGSFGSGDGGCTGGVSGAGGRRTGSDTPDGTRSDFPGRTRAGIPGERGWGRLNGSGPSSQSAGPRFEIEGADREVEKEDSHPDPGGVVGSPRGSTPVVPSPFPRRDPGPQWVQTQPWGRDAGTTTPDSVHRVRETRSQIFPQCLRTIGHLSHQQKPPPTGDPDTSLRTPWTVPSQTHNPTTVPGSNGRPTNPLPSRTRTG